MTTPRVVATDLDGTLLRSDGTLSERSRRVLAAVEDAGVHVVFVTARPPRWLDWLADAVGGHGVVISLNGACVYDVAQRETSQVVGFDPAVLEGIVRDLRVALPAVALASEGPDGPVFDHEFLSDHPVPVDAPRGGVGDRTSGPVGKLLAQLAGSDADAFFAAVEDVVGGRAHLAYSGAAGLAELSPAGVSKATALERWCSERGITAGEVWAFGDMPNDLPMLGWAGRSFAVAGAHPRVLDAVDVVVASNDDDGVARTLETLLR